MCTVRQIIRRGVETMTLTVLGLAVLASSALAAAPKGTLRVAAKADMTTLDPANAIDYQSWIVVEQMFNGLYNFDKDGRTYPDLAEALPRISADGLTYTITLRKGVRFHHGREVDAEDIKFSFEAPSRRPRSPGDSGSSLASTGPRRCSTAGPPSSAVSR